MATGIAAAATTQITTNTNAAPKQGFNLKYAPHFGMFKANAGDNLLDQLQFMADQGFTAFEDNGMMGRPVEVQTKIARKMELLGMDYGSVCCER